MNEKSELEQIREEIEALKWLYKNKCCCGGSMFIGPGLVPYRAEGMAPLDPESAKILAENLWDLYQKS